MRWMKFTNSLQFVLLLLCIIVLVKFCEQELSVFNQLFVHDIKSFSATKKILWQKRIHLGHFQEKCVWSMRR